MHGFVGFIKHRPFWYLWCLVLTLEIQYRDTLKLRFISGFILLFSLRELFQLLFCTRQREYKGVKTWLRLSRSFLFCRPAKHMKVTTQYDDYYKGCVPR